LVVVISMICTNVINPPPGATGWPDYGQNLPAGPPDLDPDTISCQSSVTTSGEMR